MRDGATCSLRGFAWLGSGGAGGLGGLGGVGRPSAPASLVLRSGSSLSATKLPRTGLSKPESSVCAAAGALARTASAGRAQKARTNCARFLRPLAGLSVTMIKSQRIQTLHRQFPATRGTHSAENVVNGVKTIMVNEPLSTALQVASLHAAC